MLSKKEKMVMSFIFAQCSKKNTCLLSPSDIINGIYTKVEFTEYEVKEIINNLILENYITVVNSDKKGQMVYCVSLNTKGKSFKRERENQKKKIMIVILRTVLLACLSFIVGIILKAIFT